MLATDFVFVCLRYTGLLPCRMDSSSRWSPCSPICQVVLLQIQQPGCRWLRILSGSCVSVLVSYETCTTRVGSGGCPETSSYSREPWVLIWPLHWDRSLMLPKSMSCWRFSSRLALRRFLVNGVTGSRTLRTLRSTTNLDASARLQTWVLNLFITTHGAASRLV